MATGKFPLMSGKTYGGPGSSVSVVPPTGKKFTQADMDAAAQALKDAFTAASDMYSADGLHKALANTKVGNSKGVVKITLKKAQPLEDEDGVFTTLGVQVVSTYATMWLHGTRNLEFERKYPELSGTFYDIRANSDMAYRWGTPPL
jgi:hypothetical protein